MNKFKAALRILFVLCIIALVVVSIVKMQNRKCSGIQVNINYDGEHPHLDEQSIITLLQQKNISILESELKDIPLEEISEVLENNNFIQKVENIDFKGTILMINVRLKTLVLHIYPEKGEQFFMDEDGLLLPFSSLIKEKIMVANGDIKKDTAQLKVLYNIASNIRKNQFCRAQFCQIYVNKNQDIELIPVIGQHTIYFGKEDRIEEKLSNIENVYTNALSYSGMDQYKELDVRFQNRVIAKQR